MIQLSSSAERAIVLANSANMSGRVSRYSDSPNLCVRN